MRKCLSIVLCLCLLLGISASAGGVYSNLMTGDMFQFGYYEQDGNRSNGAEPILWRVLDINAQTGHLLVMSQYGLETMAYHNNNGYTLWGETDVRDWLNNAFLSAFSEEEQRYITVSLVSRSADHFFLLDEAQLKKYLKREPFYCYATQYAKNHGAYINDNSGASSWLLRMDATQNRIAWVGGGGKAYSSTGNKGVNYLTSSDNVVRPVMWFDPRGQVDNAVYAVTNQTIASRTGPATEYSEPGSFLTGGGFLVRVVSRYHDGNIWWVEIEFEQNNKTVRLFTGLKRINLSNSDFSRVPIEDVQQIANGEVRDGAVSYYGPGYSYQTMPKKLSPASGTTGTVIKEENGWYCLQYNSGRMIYRVWMPSGSLRLY